MFITDFTSNKKIKLDNTFFTRLDSCTNANLNYQSIRSHYASQPLTNKHLEKPTHVDLVPITFGNILENTSETQDDNINIKKKKKNNKNNTNKHYNKTHVKILLDSGASVSIVNNSYARGNKNIPKSYTCMWSTMAGTFNTSSLTELNIKLPELNHTAMITTEFHVTNAKSNYDLIFGRDLLRELGINLNFKNNTMSWQDIFIPMKPVDCLKKVHFAIQEPKSVQNATNRIKQILDAKYEKADLKQITKELSYLDKNKQQLLLKLLQKYESMFDGSLGNYTGPEYKIELKENIKPYHAKPFPIPRVHKGTLKKEVQHLCKIDVLKRINTAEWAAPTFIIHKKNGTARLISDFRELNKQIQRKPFPIPKIQDMLLKLEGFKYATSLDLNMAYYHIKLCHQSKRLCPIILPGGKYEYQKLPMGLCNSPDIFQEKMNELFSSLEYVRTYIDDLLIVSNESFEDHLNKIDKVYKILLKAGF